MTLNDFFKQLDVFADSFHPSTLQNLLREFNLGDDVEQHFRFEDSRYQRNLLKRTSHYKALLLCFEPGQQTPIHDHAGSACGVKIIRGIATEIAYKLNSNGCLKELGKTTLSANGVTGSNDMDIHSLGNTQANERLVSLHIYSPPLGGVGNYSLESNSGTCVTAITPQENR
jgi:cysteine dioxygenase